MAESIWDVSGGGARAAIDTIEATTEATDANSKVQERLGDTQENLSDSFNNFEVSPSSDYPVGSPEYLFAEAYHLALNDKTGASMQAFLNDIMNPEDSDFINYMSNKEIVALQNYISTIQSPQSNPNLQQDLSTTLGSLKSLVQQAQQAAQSPQQNEAQSLQSVNSQIVTSIQTTAQAGGTAAGFGSFLASLLQAM